MRAHSTNRLLVEAACNLVGPEVLTAYSDLALLPPFNPDLDIEGSVPAIVDLLREQATDADALVVSVPEYAHGLPGSFKNALDWLVGSTAPFEKPVGIWITNLRAVHAPAQLREVLRTMGAAIDEKASMAIDVPFAARSAVELLDHDDIRLRLTLALDQLRFSARVARESGPR